MTPRRTEAPDHELHPGRAPRELGDPRTDPAAGLEYGSLTRERASSAARRAIAAGVVLLVAVIVLLVLLG